MKSQRGAAPTIPPPRAVRSAGLGTRIRGGLPIALLVGMPGLLAATSVCAGTGFFGVERTDGVWWFTDPEGRPFYSIGLNYCGGVSIEFPPDRGRPRGADYKKAFDQAEPQCHVWAERMKRWGFNTCASVGGNWNGRFPTTPIFRCVHYARVGKVPKHKDHGFFDVYSERFREVVESWARQVVQPEADNPLIIGWFVDNEFHLPQDETFQRRFWEVAVGAIRKYDRNHLILGTRHEFPNRSELDLRMEGEFCDVVSANYYVLRPDRELLERMHRISGRPVLLGEFGLTAADSGLPNPRTHEGTHFRTQTDRAKGYEIHVSHAAEMPFVVGTHYFMVHDRREILANNWGVQDADGKLYHGFVSGFPAAHAGLYGIHAGKLEPKRFPQAYPDLKPAHNDAPRMVDTASFGEDGSWLWQLSYLHYCCTPGRGPFFFERGADESWGYDENGFIEYRFRLKQDLPNAHLHVRYTTGGGDASAQRLGVDVNDREAAAFELPAPAADATSPPGWAYGFGPMRLAVLSVPLKIDVPKDGLTNVRFRVAEPWKRGEGVVLHGFFLGAGPARVSPDNYYALEPLR